jgi:hypothetical protein
MAPLCDVCLGVLQFHRNEVDPMRSGPRLYRRFGHHRTLSTLEHSVQQGCYVCLVIRRQLFKIRETAPLRSRDFPEETKLNVLTSDAFLTLAHLYLDESSHFLHLMTYLDLDTHTSLRPLQAFTLEKLSCM